MTGSGQLRHGDFPCDRQLQGGDDLDTAIFWESRPSLTHIRDYARAHRVSPWATLGGVLARVIASTDPMIQLPGGVGPRGSLNLFIGVVGGSGQGKGAAFATASEAVHLARGEVFDVTSIGSGEGIAAAYVERGKSDDGAGITQHSYSALFEIAEVDTLTALSGRQGSTLLAELRKVWSGERLGFQNRDASRTLPVEAHSYRASLIIGIQPTRAGAILDDADGGTPQRFLWLPATDADAPDVAPPAPEPITWIAPGEDVIPTAHGVRMMDVCDLARRTIDHARVARLRGQGDALDGHALFTRLKVAAALALLDHRGDVTDSDWELAATVMHVSNETRAGCRAAIRAQSVQVNRVRAEARAEANVVATDHSEAVTIERAKSKIIDKLTTDWTAASTIRIGLTKSLRERFEDSIEQLAAIGSIEVMADTYQGRSRQQIRLSPTSHDKSSRLTVTPESPRNSAVLSRDSNSPDSPGETSWLTTPHDQRGAAA